MTTSTSFIVSRCLKYISGNTKHTDLVSWASLGNRTQAIGPCVRLKSCPPKVTSLPGCPGRERNTWQGNAKRTQQSKHIETTQLHNVFVFFPSRNVQQRKGISTSETMWNSSNKSCRICQSLTLRNTMEMKHLGMWQLAAGTPKLGSMSPASWPEKQWTNQDSRNTE